MFRILKPVFRASGGKDIPPTDPQVQARCYTPEDDLRIALCIAIILGYEDMSQYLIEKEAPLTTMEDRFSPAHIAAILRRKCLAYMWAHGLTGDERDYQGSTIRELIRARGGPSIRDYILKERTTQRSCLYVGREHFCLKITHIHVS